jgi:hypothetical protein
MKSVFTSDIILTQTTVTDLTSSTGAQGVDSTSETGSNGGTLVAGNAAILINFPSSFRYRGGHPRVYLPPGAETDLVNSANWSTAKVTSVQTAFAGLQTAIATSTSGSFSLAGQCAVSYYSTAVTPAPPHRRVTPLIMPIATGAFTVEAEVASQRRRIGRK